LNPAGGLSIDKEAGRGGGGQRAEEAISRRRALPGMASAYSAVAEEKDWRGPWVPGNDESFLLKYFFDGEYRVRGIRLYRGRKWIYLHIFDLD